ncbi:MAG TPA: phosphatidylglycerol lysyltransferase domain-containing protein [Caproiciproducens sp.]|nr:phosphatidylglycerol lysyltransferase domain-containing protein [Caproiciproducens sp.]
MFQFEFPTIEDRKWVQPFLSKSGNMGSESAFGTLFLWGDTYFSKICRFEDYLLLCSGGHFHNYNLPVGGKNPYEAIEALIADSRERNIPFAMWGLTQDGVAELQELFPGKFEFTLDRNASDYIYTASDLIDLPGRRFHGKRNHLAQFQRSYDWSYEDITVENIEDCRTVAKKWCEANGGCGKGNSAEGESCAISRAFRYFKELELSGGLIRIDGKPAAFTIGEEINPQTYLIHFEKALDGYNGLYPAINHEFASRCLQGYKYINREEDLGLEGLRKAKLSYHPVFLLQKYLATLKEESKEAVQ